MERGILDSRINPLQVFLQLLGLKDLRYYKTKFSDLILPFDRYIAILVLSIGHILFDSWSLQDGSESCLMSHVSCSYDVNKFFPIFYKKSWTLHRLISLNKQSADDKRINFNCNIRVLDLWICNPFIRLGNRTPFILSLRFL